MADRSTRDRYTIVHRAADRGRQESAAVTNTRRRRNIGSRCCHTLLIFPFLLAIGGATLSFADLYQNRNGAEHGNGCPLYAKYDPHKDELQPGPRSSCLLSIWGEVTVAGLCVLAILWLLIMVVGGFKILSARTIAAMLLFLILFIVSATISASISVGFETTCNSIESHNKACAEHIPYNILHQAEVASWAAGGVLLVTVFIWLLLAVASCCNSCLNNTVRSRNQHGPSERTPLLGRGQVNRGTQAGRQTNRENAFEDSNDVHEQAFSNDRHRRYDGSRSISPSSDSNSSN